MNVFATAKNVGTVIYTTPKTNPTNVLKKYMHADSVLRQLYHIVDNVYTVFSQRKKTFALNVP